jgi:ankyrin repeat protein
MGNALHIAARLGHVNVVKVLIDAVDMNEEREKLEEPDSTNHTAVSLAVQHLHGPVVEVLAEKGAKMDG